MSLNCISFPLYRTLPAEVSLLLPVAFMLGMSGLGLPQPALRNLGRFRSVFRPDWRVFRFCDAGAAMQPGLLRLDA